MKSKVITQEVYDQYRNLESLGFSQRTICKELNISRGAIQNVLRNMKVGDVQLGVNVEQTVLNVQNQNDYTNWQVKEKPAVTTNKPKILFYDIETTLAKSYKPTILVIADTQAKSEESLEYLLWVGKYIADKKPDIIVHIGDHFDLPSLSSYDKGTAKIEGKRLYKDIEAGVKGFEFLNLELEKHKDYNPRKVFCVGNHEERLDRYVNHPKHYTSDPSGVECIQVTRHRNFNIGNAMKYLWRNGLKDSDAQVQDLQKAIWYIKDEIERLEKLEGDQG